MGVAFAEEIEHTVMAAARPAVSDRGALASTLKACGLAAPELKGALEVVDRKVKPVDDRVDGGGRIIIERVN